jgi:hypothetical protein
MGKSSDDSYSEQREFVWTDAATGLRVRWRVKRFTDFTALESTLWFENVRKTDTPVLEEIHDLDLRLNHSKKDQPYIVHGAHGGRYKRDDWWPFSRYLPSTIIEEDWVPASEDGRVMDLGGAYPSKHSVLSNCA